MGYYLWESLYRLNDKSFNYKQKIHAVAEFLIALLSLSVIPIVGGISGWGQKLGRALFIGLLTPILFAFLYSKIIFADTLSFGNALLRSFEYLLTFGYTKYSYSTVSRFGEIIIFLNSTIGMLWFAIIIPTLINKMRSDDE